MAVSVRGRRPKAATKRGSSAEPWKAHAGSKQHKRNLIDGKSIRGRTATRRRTVKKVKRKAVRSLASSLKSLVDCFKKVKDPRIDRRRRHLLVDIIVIAVCGVICNANGWKDIRIWAETHKEWLGKMLTLPNGIPSADTLRRTISRINPLAFQRAFLSWLRQVKSLRKEGEIIAIDGKTLCGSRFQEEGPLHIVSAWAVKNRLTLGQQQVDGKSNEITAIPELLNSLQLQGAIVTIDAMGCQRAIAQKIFDGKGDYCLAVKGNQPSLETGVEEEFEELFESGKASLVERKVLESKQRHGRYEERYYYAIKASRKLKRNSRWPGLKSIGMTVTYQGDNEEELGDGEVRYYVMSFETSVQRFADAVRSHWGIENSLHWVMDVTFCEDQSRIRKDHGAENVSWLRRLAISLLSNETSRKDSIRAKRIRAAYTTDYLETVLKSIPA